MASLETYRQILDGWPATACESKHEYQFVRERHLQAMWLEQSYFRQLKTSDGHPIEVISPGIWNAEAGPDFLKAHIRILGKDYFGDIELHLVDSSWYHHHHDSDARYDRVALHISLWQPANPKPILTSSRTELVRTYLEPALTVPLKRLVQLIDLDLYPYKKFVGSGRCAQTLFKSLPQAKLDHLFTSASFWRLEQKRAFLEGRVDDPGLRMAAGFAMALGYKTNAEPFLQLFLWLQQFAHIAADEMLVLAMGVTGFFEEPFAERWKNSLKYQHYAISWSLMANHVKARFALTASKSRPLNHPIRRLVVLCNLIADLNSKSLFKRCLGV